MWVDYTFIQATAWYLEMNIRIVDTSCSKEKPYIEISGNLEDESMPNNNPIIMIGSKSNSHYQSLLPIENATMKKDKNVIHKKDRESDQKSNIPSQSTQCVNTDHNVHTETGNKQECNLNRMSNTRQKKVPQTGNTKLDENNTTDQQIKENKTFKSFMYET